MSGRIAGPRRLGTGFVLLALLVMTGWGCSSSQPAPAKPAAAPAAATPAPQAKPAAPAAAPAAPAKVFRIGMGQYANASVLEETYQGIFEGLKLKGYEKGKNVEFVELNAQGDIAQTRPIAQRFKDANVDVMVVIGTPFAQSALAVTEKSAQPPVVHSLVSFPTSSGIAKTLQDKPAHTTGVASYPPILDAVKLIAEIKPKAKVGIIWNPGEQNSVIWVNEAKEAAKAAGLTLSDAPVQNQTDVLLAVQSLLSRGVELFLHGPDSTASAGMDTHLRISLERKAPIVTTTPTYVAEGALAAFGFDYKDLGVQTGEMVARILGGESPAKIPIELGRKSHLWVNTKTAADTGITIPKSVLDRAGRKFDSITPRK